jgi:predicted MPP superfamily phosphohydrolase
VELGVERLPRELEGLRVAHLSDLHLGGGPRSRVAVERAVEWVASRDPDLVAVTGDLVSRPDALPLLRRLLDRLPRAFAVLGNVDVAETRDPFVRAVRDTDLGRTVLLLDDARTLEVRRRRIQIVGVDPRAYRLGRSQPARLADAGADLRLLLCHYPYVLDSLEPGAFQLVLTGHMHDGQINVPYGFGKLSFAHPRARYLAGVYRRGGTAMYVSPGLGTTFVPFRFAARPEVTELTLRTP